MPSQRRGPSPAGRGHCRKNQRADRIKKPSLRTAQARLLACFLYGAPPMPRRGRYGAPPRTPLYKTMGRCPKPRPLFYKKVEQKIFNSIFCSANISHDGKVFLIGDKVCLGTGIPKEDGHAKPHPPLRGPPSPTGEGKLECHFLAIKGFFARSKSLI